SGGDVLRRGEGGPFEDLRYARRGFGTGDPLDRQVQPVEQSSLDLVCEPGAVPGALSTLLDDQHCVGLAHRRLDGLPVETRAVEPAQIDHLCVDTLLLRRLE